MQIDWASYLRVHADRRNLFIHLLAVPLFVVSNFSLVLYLVQGDFVSSVIVIVLAIIAMALQKRGHAGEINAPLPFSGRGNFLKRWFTEQFFTFPLFLLSGRWWRQNKSADGESPDAS